MQEIVFATHNENKAIEIRDILAGHYGILTLDQAGIMEEIPEDRETLEENALLKARYVYGKYGLDCFADDTGLEVYGLGGEPGVYSARYAELTGERKPEESVPDANIRKLLHRMETKNDRRARFRTIIALTIGGKEFTFEGLLEGEVIREKRGGEGFGYDPVFIPRGYDLTFAEMALDKKNKISHRALAVKLLAEFLKNYRDG